MELRVLRYFLAVAREESITGAAEALHLSQPTLSRQLHDLEKELGKQLMIRGSRRITLTEEGIMLRHRAEEILELVSRTKDEMSFTDEVISGNVYIGAGETVAVRYLAQAAQQLHNNCPDIHCHILSGDCSEIKEQLERGLIDFGLLFGTISHMHFNAIRMSIEDRGGVLVRKDSALARKSAVRPEDLWSEPLLISRQESQCKTLASWLQRDYTNLNIVATYSSLYNASLMVETGIGAALAIDGIINTTGDSPLCFRPFVPELKDNVNLVWRKHQFLSRPSAKYLEILRRLLD